MEENPNLEESRAAIDRLMKFKILTDEDYAKLADEFDDDDLTIDYEKTD